MSVKLQVIVPIYLDPLLCELYFRNYAKYKKKHVDRLIILAKPIRDINGQETSVKFIEELKILLNELDIKNYSLVDSIDINTEHGAMFHSVVNEIKDENYHTFFDEQDAYWLNDDFYEIYKQIDDYDLIAELRGQIPFLQKNLESGKYLDKFNKRFGVNHQNNLYTLSLPEFVSNRLFKKIENFNGKSGDLDLRTYCDETDIDINQYPNYVYGFDTFQSFSLEIYKKTDKIKIYSNRGIFDELGRGWDMIDLLVNKKETDLEEYKKYILYHSLSASSTAYGFLYKENLDIENLKYSLKLVIPNLGSILRINFLYQSLKYLNNFKYKETYCKNFESFPTIDLREFHSGYGDKRVDLYEYNCLNLIKCVL